MFEKVIKKILESIDENVITATYPKFSGDGYGVHKIDIKNFHSIEKINSDKRVAFIDGGNAEVLGSANFSLNVISVGCVIYQNNKKASINKFEILAFVHSVEQDNEIYYKTTFFQTKNLIKLNEMSFSSFDYTLMNGVNRADISSVANAIRRFAELIIAKLISDEKKADIVVLDGNLQSTLTNEDKYLNELYESCAKNNVVLTALSKTNSLFTDNGNLLSVILDSISMLESWFYHPIADINNKNHKAEMFFVKFHNKSKHIFRFEVLNSQKMMSEEAIRILAKSCCDPIFIGYPYGLVEADRIARVSNQEKGYLKTMILAKLRNKNIQSYLNTKNAHEILDKISF